MSEWFIPALEDFPVERALLHLGLNRAVRYYRELVVPGIGGVWFVRQLSWAVAGIQLANESNRGIPAVRIANAIEALACKLMWKDDHDMRGIRGKRAFQRYGQAYSFRELSHERYYVQVTFRQSSVNALLKLGLAEGVMRFNSMNLSQLGEDLADAFLKPKVNNADSIKNALCNWISGDYFPQSGKKVEWLGRKIAGVEENEIVAERLLADTNDGIAGSQRRRLLIESFGSYKGKDMPRLNDIKSCLKQYQDQIRQIEAAESFDAMLASSRKLIHECASKIENSQSKPVSDLAKATEAAIGVLKRYAKDYREKAKISEKSHRDADDFAKLVEDAEDRDVLAGVVKRDGAILSCPEGNTIMQGPLFKRWHDLENDQGDGPSQGDDVGSEESSTKNKIRQLFTLWGNCSHGE